MKTPREIIVGAILSIQPFDDTEASHHQDALDWAQSDAPLFRVVSPDTPPKHLVSYFVLFDESQSKIMLIDHVKANLWLPTGGHVDQDEDPAEAATREAMEELTLEAQFDTPFGDKPQFITVTKTRGYGEHTDVTLWYVIRGDSNKSLTYDTREMRSIKWLTFDEILAMDTQLFDPHLHRFVAKMKRTLIQA